MEFMRRPNQVVAVIVAAGAGPAAIGGLRAVQTLLGPAQLVALSGDSVALPAASRGFLRTRAPRLDRVRNSLRPLPQRGGRALRGGPCCRTRVDPSPCARTAVRAVREHRAAAVARAARDGVEPERLCSSTIGGAAGKSLARAELVGSSARIAAVWVLLQRYGLAGAAWGVTIGSVLHASAMWMMYRDVIRKVARRPALTEESGDSRGRTDQLTSAGPTTAARGVARLLPGRCSKVRDLGDV